jgi:transcriptional regulator with XRE-family HTH domain
MEDGDMVFASRLAALLAETGVTQYRLAQLSGVSKQALSKLVLGEREPSWRTVQALAKGLGVPVTAFLPVEEDKDGSGPAGEGARSGRRSKQTSARQGKPRER